MDPRRFLALAFLSSACDPTAAVLEGDAREETFLRGKADGVEDGSWAAAAVLVVANEADQDTLLFDVGLAELDTGERAADNIIAFRFGPDLMPGTADDRVFHGLAQLDAIPYFGPVAFARMLAYAVDVVPTGPDAQYVPALPSGVLALLGADPAFKLDETTVRSFGETASTSRRSHLVPLRVEIAGTNPGELTASLSAGQGVDPSFELPGVSVPADGRVRIDEAWETTAPLGLPTNCIVIAWASPTCHVHRITRHHVQAELELAPGGVARVNALSYGVRIHNQERSAGGGSSSHDFAVHERRTYIAPEVVTLSLDPMDG